MFQYKGYREGCEVGQGETFEKGIFEAGLEGGWERC